MLPPASLPLRSPGHADPAEPESTRCATIRVSAIVALVTCALLLPAPAVLAGNTNAAESSQTTEHAPDGAPDADGVDLAAALTDWLAGVDRAIRSLTATTDRLAGRALSGSIGTLARRQDDRMAANATQLLAGAPAAAYAQFTLDGRDAQTDVVQMAAHAKMRGRAISVDSGPPAAPERR